MYKSLYCFLLLLAPLAMANGGDRDDDDDVIISGDSVLSSTTKGGIALSGADMAIDDCLATYSRLFGLWQDAKVNLDCEALNEAKRLDAEGQYSEAATMRCSTKQYKKVFGKGQTCIDKIILAEPTNPTEPEEVDERFLAQQMELESMRGELDATRDELAAVVELVEQQSEVVTRAASRQVVQAKPKYSDEDRQRIKAILSGEASDE